LAQFSVPKFSNTSLRGKTDSSKTIDFIGFNAVLMAGIPQAKRKLSDNFNH